MKQEIDVNCEPLPGYRLIERLGAGGYGEVWRAEAPGGLTKAIKFVFGKQHEKRAHNELRALDHVRGVRHPFLLSLERIEVIDGRLLVVTELADQSIKDRFDACRREGHRGIPRDELLAYLRDAADALDFMSDTHALQHLDIKPENLLLLAGHLKVADFGLVKDVRQSQASLIGGMTPLYAAPEVFRGTPSRHSDQYSLAIVYQEMLTGTLPFAGSNAAELTLQHLNDEPDLTALPQADRYAVSRALSKDPQHRYATCRQLVESLLSLSSESTHFESHSRSREFETHPQFTLETPRPTTPTEFFDDGESADWNLQPQLVAELPLGECRIVDLPPIDLKGRDSRSAPALVLGIGGAGGRVVAHVRRIIHEQYAEGQLPAVQLLLLDTDSRALSSLAEREAGGLTPDEMLSLPLRRPQHYRDNSQQLLHWLSRRWLYNIPRSLRTEGLRPLGRLALADHARQAGQRIRRAVTQATDAGAIAASIATSGIEFRNGALQVMIVASISGGTGGGMALDIGYAVRAILERMGITESRIVGVMMHSTERDARRAELARVNAFSWLSEFHHFEQEQNPYPGDPSCGLPAHPPGVRAFDQTYLLHLGENLDVSEFDQATQAVAEYLRINVLSAARPFFDAARDAEPHGDGPANESLSSNLRSFGLSQRSPASREFCDNFAAAISQQVLSAWVGANRSARTTGSNNHPGGPTSGATATADDASDADCLQLIGRLRLDAAAIEANARALIELQLGSDPASFLSVWLDKQGAKSQDQAAQLRAVDQMFSARYEGAVDGEISLLGTRRSDIIAPIAEKIRSELRQWITRRIDDPRHRVYGARRAVEWVNRHLLETLAQVQQRQAALTAKIDQQNRDVAATGKRTAGSSRSGGHKSGAIVEYLTVCLDRVAVIAAQDAVSLLLSDAKALSDEVTALGREIDQIASTVGRATNPRAANSFAEFCKSSSGSEAQLASNLVARIAEIAAQVDRQLQTEYLDGIGGLAKTIMQGGRPRAQLTAKLHELARRAVSHTLAGIDVLGRPGGDSGGSSNDDLRSTLALATPTLLEFGGRRRVLAVLPRESHGAAVEFEFSRQLGIAPTTIVGTDSNLTLCVEADRLSLPHIALELIERRRDRAEFADRVHCRTDIVWTPLLPPASSSHSVDWPPEQSHRNASQQAMSKTSVM